MCASKFREIYSMKWLHNIFPLLSYIHVQLILFCRNLKSYFNCFECFEHLPSREQIFVLAGYIISEYRFFKAVQFLMEHILFITLRALCSSQYKCLYMMKCWLVITAQSCEFGTKTVWKYIWNINILSVVGCLFGPVGENVCLYFNTWNYLTLTHIFGFTSQGFWKRWIVLLKVKEKERNIWNKTTELQNLLLVGKWKKMHEKINPTGNLKEFSPLMNNEQMSFISCAHD